MRAELLCHVWLLLTPQTVPYPAPLSMEFPRQESWSGLPFPPPGEFLNPGIEPSSPAAPAWQAYSLPLSHLGTPYTCIHSMKVLMKSKVFKRNQLINCTRRRRTCSMWIPGNKNAKMYTYNFSPEHHGINGIVNTAARIISQKRLLRCLAPWWMEGVSLRNWKGTAEP